MNRDEDFAIIDRVLEGDVEAYSELVKKYQDKVLSLCRSMMGQQSSAEDAAQEAFLRAYRFLHKFKRESAFATWLYRVTANHCLNLIAKRKKDRFVPLEEWTQDPQSGQRPDAVTGSIEKVETSQTLAKLLELLSPQERSILLMREVQGFTYEELAQSFDISIQAVKSRLFRARQALIKEARKMKVG